MKTTARPRQQQQLERTLGLEATQLPTPRPRRTWLILLVGISAGLLLGAGSRWLITPIAPEPAPEQKRCKFNLTELSDSQLEPVLTAEQRARINNWLGPQLPKPAAPAPVVEPTPSDRC